MAKKSVDSSDINDILKSIVKDYDLSIGTMAEVAKPTRVITTDNVVIDWATAVGGIPLGRIIEFYGPPSCGKTTLAFHIAAALQKKIIEEDLDDLILYADFEQTVDKEYAASVGFDIDHPSVLLMQPYSLEQGTNSFRRLLPTGRIRLSIWDSVAEMLPEATADAETGQSQPALRARLMSQFLQQISPQLNKHDSTAIFLNHEMDKIDMSGRSTGGTTTPGGKALPFYCSLRINFRKLRDNYKLTKDPVSQENVQRVDSSDVVVKVVKNKVGDPFRQVTVRVRFGKGFDKLWSAIEVLKNHKLLPSSAGYYYFDKEVSNLAHPDMDVSSTGRPNIRGEASLAKFGEIRPEWVEKVSAMAGKVLEEYGTVQIDQEDEGKSIVSLVGEEDLLGDS